MPMKVKGVVGENLRAAARLVPQARVLITIKTMCRCRSRSTP